jgi:hypothetical protein
MKGNTISNAKSTVPKNNFFILLSSFGLGSGGEFNAKFISLVICVLHHKK